jgi:hypothetical protein
LIQLLRIDTEVSFCGLTIKLLQGEFMKAFLGLLVMCIVANANAMTCGEAIQVVRDHVLAVNVLNETGIISDNGIQVSRADFKEPTLEDYRVSNDAISTIFFVKAQTNLMAEAANTLESCITK